MKGSLPNHDQTDLFRNRLTSIISLDHELCRLSEEIDWPWIDEELDGYYAREGRPS
ncbi:IS5/IS1182 family transposase, partial [Neolewinella litorea]